MQNSLFYRKKPTKHSAGNLTNYLKRKPKTRYAEINLKIYRGTKKEGFEGLLRYSK